MADFGTPFSGLKNDRILTKEELIRAIRFFVAAEYEAVQLYDSLKESIDDEKIKEVLKKISDEERVHAGEFLKVISYLDPTEVQLYSEGFQEVDDIINKQAAVRRAMRTKK